MPKAAEKCSATYVYPARRGAGVDVGFRLRTAGAMVTGETWITEDGSHAVFPSRELSEGDLALVAETCRRAVLRWQAVIR